MPPTFTLPRLSGLVAGQPEDVTAVSANDSYLNGQLATACNYGAPGVIQPGVVNAGDCTLAINSSSSVTVNPGTVWVNVTGTGLMVTSPASTTITGIPVATT